MVGEPTVQGQTEVVGVPTPEVVEEPMVQRRTEVAEEPMPEGAEVPTALTVYSPYPSLVHPYPMAVQLAIRAPLH